MSITDIRQTWLRRVVICIAFPTVTIWKAPEILLSPFWAVLSGIEAFVEAVKDYYDTKAIRLLVAGFVWAWDKEYHTNNDAALERAKAFMNK